MSIHERDSLHLSRVKSELKFIKQHIADVDKNDFLTNDVLQHALSMALITIGECANHLSDEFKNQHPNIEWVQIVAVRNIAAHGYWQLNMAQIWQAVEEDIPKLDAFFAQFN